jgi:ribonuclease HI
MAKTKFYVVWKGRKTGIFSTWQEASAQVTGYTGAEYKSFESQSAAETAFNAAYADYMGKSTHAFNRPGLNLVEPPIAESYSVDASCIGNPGPMEYRCLHTTTRQLVFAEGPFARGSNNIGEFLAIVEALVLFEQNGWTEPLYTDSKTALTWVSHKKCKTKLQRDEANALIFERIARAEEWLATHTCSTKVLKWDTAGWGEIPADYGRK